MLSKANTVISYFISESGKSEIEIGAMNDEQLSSTFATVFSALIQKHWNMSMEDADHRRFGNQLFTSTYTWILAVRAEEAADVDDEIIP